MIAVSSSKLSLLYFHFVRTPKVFFIMSVQQIFPFSNTGGDPISLLPPQYLVLTCNVLPCVVLWCHPNMCACFLIIILSYMYLTVSDIEHFFMCPLLFIYLPCWSVTLRFGAILSSDCSFPYCWVQNVPSVFWMRDPCLITWLAHSFSQSVSVLFISLTACVTEQESFILV